MHILLKTVSLSIQIQDMAWVVEYMLKIQKELHINIPRNAWGASKNVGKTNKHKIMSSKHSHEMKKPLGRGDMIHSLNGA